MKRPYVPVGCDQQGRIDIQALRSSGALSGPHYRSSLMSRLRRFIAGLPASLRKELK